MTVENDHAVACETVYLGARYQREFLERRFLFPVFGVPLDLLVAFARGVFQAVAVLNLDMPSRVGNQSRSTEESGSHRNTGPPRPQHVCQKFMGQRYIVGINPILAH